jgi:hypothetical protein
MHDDAQHDELIARITDELRTPVALDPGFDARVMAEVRRATPAVWRRALRWWTEPRPLRVSPLAGLACAAGVAALLVVGLVLLRPTPPSPIHEAAAASAVRSGRASSLDRFGSRRFQRLGSEPHPIAGRSRRRGLVGQRAASVGPASIRLCRQRQGMAARSGRPPGRYG